MNLNSPLNTQMTERFNVAGAMLVKLFGDHRRRTPRFAAAGRSVRDNGIRSAMYGRVFFVALGIVGAVGAAMIYGVGGQLVVSGEQSTGHPGRHGRLVTRVYQPLTGLTNARVDLMTSLVSFERVFEVLDAPVAITDAPGRSISSTGRGASSSTTCRSATRRPTNGIASLELRTPEQDPTGACSTDVEPATSSPARWWRSSGASGAGKSTLAALIPRLYDVTGGAVRVDGHDVRDLTGDSLRAAIGVVSQDPHLFHESIGDNLRYAKPDATAAELVEACRAARIHDTIAALPDGYDTVVGERGYRLSGGEKQRLAIARLLLKDPAIIILDEATSSLDNENEVQVQAALETRPARPHRDRHRPPAVDDPRRRPDRRARRRAHRRARHPRRAGRPGRSLRSPAPRAGDLVRSPVADGDPVAESTEPAT